MGLVSAFALAYAPVFATEAAAEAAAQNKANIEKMDNKLALLAKDLLEGIHTKQQAVNVLKGSGVSIEALKVIEADLTKRMPAGLKPPPMSMKDREILIDGKPSGLKVISFINLQVKYQGRTWTADASKTSDVNYLSLVKFLENKKVTSLMSLLLPEAKAQFGFGNMGSGAFTGMLVGTAAGALISLFTGGLGFAAVGLGALAGALIGGVYGGINQNRRDQEMHLHDSAN